MLVQNQRGMTIALINLGDVERMLGNFERARASYVEAIALAQESEDQVALARMHQRLGDLIHDDGAIEAARAHWEQALNIREALGHSEEAIALRNRVAGTRHL